MSLPQNVVTFVPTGTGDAITGTPSPVLSSYSDLVEVKPVVLIGFYAAGDNTGPVTIDLNGLGPIPLYKLHGAIDTPLVAGDIRANQYVMAVWSPFNSSFQVLTPLGNAPPVLAGRKVTFEDRN
jgi:hypothetical protein